MSAVIVLAGIGCGIGVLSMIFLFHFEDRLLDGKRDETYNLGDPRDNSIYSMYRAHPRRGEVIHALLVLSSIVLTSSIAIPLGGFFFMIGLAAFMTYLQRSSLRPIEKVIQIGETTRIKGIAEGIRWEVERDIPLGRGDADTLLERRINSLQDISRGKSRLHHDEIMNILALLGEQSDQVGFAAHQSIEKMKSLN